MMIDFKFSFGRKHNRDGLRHGAQCCPIFVRSMDHSVSAVTLISHRLMSVSSLVLLTILFLLCFAPLRVSAADQDSPEVKLRTLLRATMLQLRDAQNQVSTLQTAQVESEKEKSTLKKQIEDLTQQSASDKEAAQKAISELEAKMTAQSAQITQLTDALTKWKSSYQKAVQIANVLETKRAKLASDNILLQRRVDDAESKNYQLYTIGTEILNRYERFGLGTALTAREPFVGLTRVKLQNLSQDYRDKLSAQIVKPDQLANNHAQQQNNKSQQPVSTAPKAQAE